MSASWSRRHIATFAVLVVVGAAVAPELTQWAPGLFLGISTSPFLPPLPPLPPLP